jgi:hypothetical protein
VLALRAETSVKLCRLWRNERGICESESRFRVVAIRCNNQRGCIELGSPEGSDGWFFQSGPSRYVDRPRSVGRRPQ